MSRLTFLFYLTSFVFPVLTYAQDEAKIQEIYMDYCRMEGFENVHLDSDGDVQFTYEELQYYIGVNEDDLDYANLVLPNIWPIESEEEMLRALKACNYVTQNTKIIKAYVQNDNVMVACEIFVDRPEDFRDFIKVGIDFIGDAVERFVGQMQ